MANALQAKADVVNELRNRLYYNQIEIQRLLNSPAGISHKDVVDATIGLLKDNVLSMEAIQLIESYFAQPAIPQQATESVAERPLTEEDLGVKKVD